MRNSNPILLVEHDHADATTSKTGFRLFRHFQLFSVPAIVIILIVAVLGLRFILRQFVLFEAERDAIRISCGIRDCEMHRFFGENHDKEQSLSIPQEELPELDHQMRTFLTTFDIVKIKIFNNETKIVYSTDPKIIGMLNPDNAKLAKALRGSAVSKYETKKNVWDLTAEERVDVEIVETYVPVRGSDGRIIGSFEIYKDVTKDLVIADRTLIRAGVMLSTTVLSVFATLMFVIRRAEKLKSINQQLLSEIAERKRAEQRLKQANEEWKSTFDSISDLVSIQDKDFKFVRINKAFADVFEMKPEEATGKTCYELVHGTKEPWPTCPLKEVLDTKKPKRVEFFEPHLGLYLEVSVSPIFSEDGEMVGSVHITKDITERKSTEKKQDELLEKVDNINKELKEFASIVSHDLKAPLRGIKTLASWILSDCADKLDDQANEQMNLLLERVERMYNLIEGALQYSRAGRAEGKRVQVNLNNFIPEIINMVVPPENITVTIENELPVIECEETHIMQLFQNLLSNAIKYMDKPQGWIKIGCVEQDGFWKFGVADNGPGIEEKHFEKIFKIFQALPTSPDFQGTGVGLTVAKKIVELYDGKIWVESKVSEGSTFFFTLPKSDAPQEVSIGAASENIKYSN